MSNWPRIGNGAGPPSLSSDERLERPPFDSERGARVRRGTAAGRRDVSCTRRVLSEVVPEVLSELDVDVVLERVLTAARELTA